MSDKIREEFEAWHSGEFCIAGDWCNTDYAKELAWQAWKASRAEMAPEGWKIVPVEPTPEMIGATSSLLEIGILSPRNVISAWGRMLAAAPKP